MYRLAVSLLVATATMLAQQPNTPLAGLEVNGQDGPPWPIVSVAIAIGSTASLDFHGTANAPIGLVQASNLQAGALTTPFGIVDLDLTPFVFILDGTVATNTSGMYSLQIPIAPAVPPGISVAFQGALPDPASVAGATLTAATSIVTVPGTYTQTLLLANDSYAQVSLASQGFEAVFYGQAYSSVYVNSNGSVSFGAGINDFTPSIPEHLMGQPRVALLWADLAPNVGGAVSWTLDQTGSLPEFRVDFVGVRENATVVRTFDLSYRQQIRPIGSAATVGNVTVTHGLNPNPPGSSSLVGISPGLSLSPISSGPMDLTVAQSGGGTLGGPDQALFEFFNTMIGSTANPYDLSNVTLSFIYVPPQSYALQ